MRSSYLSVKGEFWKKVRMRVLVRDDFTCQVHRLGLCNEPCGENRLRDLQVHHIRPRITGGTHDPDNLITLCREHHMQLHPWMRRELPMKQQKIGGYPVKEL